MEFFTKLYNDLLDLSQQYFTIVTIAAGALALVCLVLIIVLICVGASKSKAVKRARAEAADSGELAEAKKSAAELNDINLRLNGEIDALNEDKEGLSNLIKDKCEQLDQKKAELAAAVESAEEQSKQLEELKAELESLKAESQRLEEENQQLNKDIEELRAAEKKPSKPAKAKKDKEEEPSEPAAEQVEKPAAKKPAANKSAKVVAEDEPAAEKKPAAKKPAAKKAEAKTSEPAEKPAAKKTASKKAAKPDIIIGDVTQSDIKEIMSLLVEDLHDSDELIIENESSEPAGGAESTDKVSFVVKYDRLKSSWVVLKKGQERPVRRVDTKDEAIKVSKELAKKYGANLVIHKKDGKFQKVR